MVIRLSETVIQFGTVICVLFFQIYFCLSVSISVFCARVCLSVLVVLPSKLT